MKKELQKFHNDVLSTHNSMMFDELIYEHDIMSPTLKEVTFECKTILRGYFAKKGRQKYWIDEHILEHLPIKPGTECEEYKYQESVVLRPLGPIPFRITPKQIYDDHKDFVDSLVQFEHTQPDYWTLLKMVSLMSYVSKVFICIASEPEFGKSSIFEVLNGITNMLPVFKPRSVPGVLNKINTTGAMVFDDVLACKKEVRDIMEEISLQVGGGKSVYVNGALKSSNTKSKYNCRLQSILYVYNNYDCYKDKSGTVNRYFDTMFDNNKAIDSRFLKLKFEGKLLETFDKNFNLPQIAEDNKMYYINLAKHLLWLQHYKTSNEYKLRYTNSNKLGLKGRKKIVYDDIVWCIDMYSPDSNTYDKFIYLFDRCISTYKDMLR